MNTAFKALAASEAVYNQLRDLFGRSGLKYQIARPIVNGAAWRAEAKIETGLFGSADLDVKFFCEIAKLPVSAFVTGADSGSILLTIRYAPAELQK